MFNSLGTFSPQFEQSWLVFLGFTAKEWLSEVSVVPLQQSLNDLNRRGVNDSYAQAFGRSPLLF